MTLEQRIMILRYQAVSVQYTLTERRNIFRKVRKLEKELHKQKENERNGNNV